MIGYILFALAVLLLVDTLCYGFADWPDSQLFMESFEKRSAWIPGAGFVAVFRYGWRR